MMNMHHSAGSVQPMHSVSSCGLHASQSNALLCYINVNPAHLCPPPPAGVGFSVEAQCVAKLPAVAERFMHSSSTVVVEDSREGWARALREVLALLWTGQVSQLASTSLSAQQCLLTLLLRCLIMIAPLQRCDL